MKTKLHLLLVAILFSFNSFGQAPHIVTITGTGVGGWNMPGSVVLTSTDGGINYSANNFELTNDANIKFVEDGTASPWAHVAGSVFKGDFPSGTVVLDGVSGLFKDGGSFNVVGTQGFWNVTINIVTGEFTFSEGQNFQREVRISGGGLASPIRLSSPDGDDFSKESVTFATGGDAQFIETVSAVNATPTDTWSAGGFPSGTGILNGTTSIPVAAGTYFTFFNAVSGIYEFVDTSMSIVGGFQGWNNNGTALKMIGTDNVHYTLNNQTFVTDTELKFLDNNNWNFQWGSTTNPSGFPNGSGKNGGQNIAVPAGKYNITFNRTTLEYSFVSLNPAVEYVGTTSTPATKSLSSGDGINYKGQEVSFDGAGSGTFNEIASAGNEGPAFFSWNALPSPASGFWNLSVNKDTGENSFTPTVVGVIGDFAPSNWGSDVVFSSANGVDYTLDGIVITKARANFKFRDNHDWPIQFGHAVALDSGTFSPMSGTLVMGDGIAKDMFLAPGTYKLTFNRVTLAYSITDVSLAVNKFDTNKFSAYPNPSKNSWNFASRNSNISSVNIVDMLGRNVISKNAFSKEVSVDASSLSKGMYFAKITSGDSVQTLKVIKD